MPYFNAPLHSSFMGKPAPRPPVSLVYCDDCAEAAIPLPATGRDGRTGSRHWESGFRWAPYYGGGKPCDACGDPVDKGRAAQ